MSFGAHCCMGLLLGCLISCGSSRKDSTETKKIDSARQTSTSPQDTTMPDVPIANPAPAPGTVHVVGKIVGIHPSENRNEGTIDFRVFHISRYGSSTPAIAPQDTLLIKTGKLPKIMKVEKKLSISLSHLPVFAKFKDTSPQWQLINIDNIQVLK